MWAEDVARGIAAVRRRNVALLNVLFRGNSYLACVEAVAIWVLLATSLRVDLCRGRVLRVVFRVPLRFGVVLWATFLGQRGRDSVPAALLQRVAYEHKGVCGPDVPITQRLVATLDVDRRRIGAVYRRGADGPFTFANRRTFGKV